MEFKVASEPFRQLSQQVCPQSPSSSQTLASMMSSKRRSRSNSCPVTYRYRSSDSAIFGAPSSGLLRSRSYECPKSRLGSLKRSCSAEFGLFSDEESSNQIRELSRRLSDNTVSPALEFVSDCRYDFGVSCAETELHVWEEDGNFSGSIQRKANCLDLPLSLRMIKRKLQRRERFIGEARETADSSVKSAFSSMVFIIQELQRYTLQMKDDPCYEDLQWLMVHVRQDTRASFVWLFERVFSRTPTLMVYLMILLANFSVHSMGISTAASAASPSMAAVSVAVIQNNKQQKSDSSAVKPCSTSSLLIEGEIIIKDRNFQQVSDGNKGDDHFSNSSLSSSSGSTSEAEAARWNSIVEEASKMQGATRSEALDRETIDKLVAPLTAKIEADDYADYLKTEALYQIGLSKDHNNHLLLANFAQFLYLVVRDYDRAEDYFKRAVAVEPADAETLNKYGNFLWRVRNDLWAAEQTFLEAIEADPDNSFYTSNYAHFLWNTGADDTCFPLASWDQAEIDATEG